MSSSVSSARSNSFEDTVSIEKLVHGGQGFGTLTDGRKVFVWNALPGELVNVRVTKKRRDYAEGIAEKVLEASPQRVEPKDEAYLSTSPWQMMDFAYENEQKRQILVEAFRREHVQYEGEVLFTAGESEWRYRNKMEYSFWGDDSGLHLALFHRGSHGKRIVTGSSIARQEIDEAAQKIVAILQGKGVRASQLKTVMLRCSQAGEVVAALFTKDNHFPEISELAAVCRGIAVVYSNPKSPASVVTEHLYQYGDVVLSDVLLGHKIEYNVFSFFQVNIPVFLQVLQTIKQVANDEAPAVDMYSGVGTIGVCCGASTLVESDVQNVRMAEKNARQSGKNIEVIHANSESALDTITSENSLIVDPPRAGLHTKLITQILAVSPPSITYLSCNPSTQARDIALLQDKYHLTHLGGYNFFPRTPHIESLAILKRQ